MKVTEVLNEKQDIILTSTASKKRKSRFVKFALVFIAMFIILGDILNERWPGVWINESRIDRNIVYFFEHMENHRVFYSRFGWLVSYPYYQNFSLAEITSFVQPLFGNDPYLGVRWMRAYVFEPGTTRREIMSIANIRGPRLPRVINEGYTQILFIDSRRRIVCNIHSAAKDYEFDFGDFQNGYIELTFIDSLRVSMHRNEETGRIVVSLDDRNSR